MITEKQHQEWKKDVEELHKFKTENMQLRKAVEEAKVIIEKPITEFGDVQRLIKQVVQLQAEKEQREKIVKTVIEKLKKKRIHPLDIIPIEYPHLLVKELEQALE